MSAKTFQRVRIVIRENDARTCNIEMLLVRAAYNGKELDSVLVGLDGTNKTP